ncbi:MAG: hypothetical protein ABSC03_13430 [Verrucomicrobiota bacterium]
MMKLKPILLAAGVALLVAGCSTPSSDATRKITAFSQATDLTTRNTAAAFDTLERRHFELKIARVVAEGGWEHLNATNLAPFLPPEDVQARLLVLNGLHAYATKLAAIMGNESLDAFDKATTGLGESLGKVDDDFVTARFLSQQAVDPRDLKLATTAMNALGRWIISTERQKRVRESVAEMNPHVTNLVALLSRDLVVLRRNLSKTYDEAVQAQKVFLLKNQATLDANAQRTEIKAIADLLVEQAKADTMMKSLDQTIRELGTTHAQLTTAFDRSSVALDQLLADLLDEGKRVQKFYDSLNIQ